MILVLQTTQNQKWEWFCEERDKIEEEIRLNPKASLSRKFWHLPQYPEKEAPAMQVEYNGFTGELVKLEKKPTGKYELSPYDRDKHPIFAYDLSIYDCENQATHSFTGVKLENIKFLCGAVSFGG